jgi:hypothetical protein
MFRMEAPSASIPRQESRDRDSGFADGRTLTDRTWCDR